MPYRLQTVLDNTDKRSHNYGVLASIHDYRASLGRRDHPARSSEHELRPLASDTGQPMAVLATAPDGAVRAHITKALRQVVTIRFATRLADLNELPGVAPIAALLYLDGSYDRIEPAQWIAQLRTLRESWGALPIIGYAPLTARAFEQGVMATRAGVNEIALHGRDMLCDSLMRIVDATVSRGVCREILPYVLAVAPALSGDTLRIVPTLYRSCRQMR